MDTWDDKTSGQKRSRMKVVAENLQLLGSRTGGDAPSGTRGDHEGGSEDAPAPRRSAFPAAAPSRPHTPAATPNDNDDDIPF